MSAKTRGWRRSAAVFLSHPGCRRQKMQVEKANRRQPQVRRSTRLLIEAVACPALQGLQHWSTEYFGARNVSSGIALGIRSITRKEGKQCHAPPSTETVLQTAQNAATTALGYMQSAVGAAAQYLPQGVVDPMSSYMSTSSATATMRIAPRSRPSRMREQRRLTNSRGLPAPPTPTREHFGAQPGDHSSGAGALPGILEEPHVTRLPKESAHLHYDSGPIDTEVQVALKLTEQTLGNESATGDARHVGGVGALVGRHDEGGVAVLPDERARGQGNGTRPTETVKADATKDADTTEKAERPRVRMPSQPRLARALFQAAQMLDEHTKAAAQQSLT
ncbi:hypothetical protein C2E23DRAFT_855326 [Lenzites betulinus]|nr:hypothetical protein C2E23DRAFT_855326 [Lenzites betulinus]